MAKRSSSGLNWISVSLTPNSLESHAHLDANLLPFSLLYFVFKFAVLFVFAPGGCACTVLDLFTRVRALIAAQSHMEASLPDAGVGPL